MMGALLGAVIASSLVFGLISVDSANKLSVRLHPSTLHLGGLTTSQFAWPSLGSAAVEIAGRDFVASSNQKVLPIASLTKLMTAYVLLQALPLSGTDTGPCWTVTSQDVSTYLQDKYSNQSSAMVAEGEVLCENQLLAGMMVHSASNFASMAVELAVENAPISLGLSSLADYVTAMNSDAQSLSMTNTTYVDPTGFDPGNVSSAHDQLLLTNVLMGNEYFRSVVSQPTVSLPVAGTLTSYTPELGTEGVVGVKSGRTSAAGGCDVMARNFTVDGRSVTLYVAVLGQGGSDVLASAGQAALTLSTSVVKELRNVRISKVRVGDVGWGSDRTAIVSARTVTIPWWVAMNPLRATVQLQKNLNNLSANRIIGYLDISGSRHYRIALKVDRALHSPSLWQRIR